MTFLRSIAAFLHRIGLHRLAHYFMPNREFGEYLKEVGYHLVPFYPACKVNGPNAPYWLVRELSFRERQRTPLDVLLVLETGITVLGKPAQHYRWKFTRGD